MNMARNSSWWPRRGLLAIVAPTLAVLLGACGGSSGGPSAPALVSIEVTPTNPSIAAGTSTPLVATGVYADATHADLTSEVTWTTSDASVATVEDATGTPGLTRGVQPGNVQITAELDAVVGQTDLTVTSATLVSIEVTPTNPSVALGTSQQFAATGVFTDGTNQDLTAAVDWSCGDTAVATPGSTPSTRGRVTSLATGTTTVVATAGSVSGSTVLTVTPAVLVTLEVTPTNPSIALG